MKNNKIHGSIVGGILGFIFVVTCTSPLSSDASEATGSGKYQISSCHNGSNTVFETIINTENGQVVARNWVGTGNFSTDF